MLDVFDEVTRSRIMSLIKGKNTKPELLVRRFLFAHGFRFRVCQKNLPGKPDIVLAKYKTVIFVNGCFWHGHENCKEFKLPKTRTEWWQAKIERNIAHDRTNIQKLKEMGYQVIVIWGCELKKGKEATLVGVLERLKHANKSTT
jgi:DNA mismatch endonuclease (patch repair protein)